MQQQLTSTAIVSLRFLMVDLLWASFSTAAANSSKSMRPGDARGLHDHIQNTLCCMHPFNRVLLTIPIAVKHGELLLKGGHLPCGEAEQGSGHPSACSPFQYATG
jgi:hypothetical protein